MTTTEPTTIPSVGQGDLDFIFGSWIVHHRKLLDATDPNCHEWTEFQTTSRTEPVLFGLSHVERIYADAVEGADAWEGFTLRQFDPAESVWRIWWASTRSPGKLDAPLVGRFVEGVGEFFGDDTVNDRAIKVRFE
jgi:hypothetical protein